VRAGWRKSTIGEVCDVVNGGTPKTGVAANWDGPHRWITPAEMGRRSDPYVGKTERQLTDAGLAAANLLPPRSVILSSRAPIGHLVINTVPMATNQGCKGLVPKSTLDYKYLFYYLGSVVGLLNDLGTGATFKELSGGRLKEVPIPLPPLPEQQCIVAILDEAFAGLATATANAQKNLENARELFDSYLNSVFESKRKGWRTQALEELCERGRVITYGVIKLGSETPDGVPCLRTSNVRWLRIEADGVKKISPALSNEFRRTILHGGEVLVNVRGTLGGVAIAAHDMKGWNVSREVAVVPVDPSHIEPEYLAFFIATRASQNWLTEVQKGVAYVGINIADLRTLPISFPDRTMQIRLIEQLQDLSAAARRLEAMYDKRLSHIAELRQAILQAAFSGELTSPPSHAIKEAAE
jgi:type I restriction enzyme, S subunit